MRFDGDGIAKGAVEMGIGRAPGMGLGCEGAAIGTRCMSAMMGAFAGQSCRCGYLQCTV